MEEQGKITVTKLIEADYINAYSLVFCICTQERYEKQKEMARETSREFPLKVKGYSERYAGWEIELTDSERVKISILDKLADKTNKVLSSEPIDFERLRKLIYVAKFICHGRELALELRDRMNKG